MTAARQLMVNRIIRARSHNNNRIPHLGADAVTGHIENIAFIIACYWQYMYI